MGAKHKRKRRGVVHDTSRAPWSNDEIDLMLDEILPLDAEERLMLWECRIAEQLERGRPLPAFDKRYGKGRSKKPVELALWKTASGYGRFARYIPGRRLSRRGMPWTWVEQYILRIGFDPKYDARKAELFKTDQRVSAPSLDFVSLVLQRPAPEIAAAIERFISQRAPAGFGL